MIMEILQLHTGRDLLILALTANMASGTTEAADVPPDVKPSAELLQVLLQQKS